jgi:hypothetical protein
LPRNAIAERSELPAAPRNLASAVIVDAKTNEAGFDIKIRKWMGELLSAPTLMARPAGG